MKHSNTWLKSILIVSALLLSAASPSPNPKTNPVESAQQSNNTRNRQNDTVTNERGTEKLPIAVKLLNTGKSDAETAQEAAQEKNANSTNLWVIRLGFAGLGIAALQLIAFIIQAYRLKQTILVMKNTAEQQLRAYVSASPDFIVAFDEATPTSGM